MKNSFLCRYNGFGLMEFTTGKTTGAIPIGIS